MSKNTHKDDNALPPLEGARMSAPNDMRSANSRADGFWDETSGYPIFGRLLFAREVTPKRGPSAGRLKRYYVLELLASTMLSANDERNQPARVAKAGEVVAVWGTSGNSDLNRLAGCQVWIRRNPESEWIDTGKGNPMKTYDMKFSGEGRPIRVLAFSEAAAEQVDHSHVSPSAVEGEPF